VPDATTVSFHGYSDSAKIPNVDYRIPDKVMNVAVEVWKSIVDNTENVHCIVPHHRYPTPLIFRVNWNTEEISENTSRVASRRSLSSLPSHNKTINIDAA
jgi:hypothetical protein